MALSRQMAGRGEPGQARTDDHVTCHPSDVPVIDQCGCATARGSRPICITNQGLKANGVSCTTRLTFSHGTHLQSMTSSGFGQMVVVADPQVVLPTPGRIFVLSMPLESVA